MAAISTIVAVGALAVGAASYVEGQSARKEQAAATSAQAQVQGQIQSEQKASNVAASANERRQQLREARVRRARIMQASQNTGAGGSSGEFGAISGLGTNLSANIGANLGNIQAAGRVSDLGQAAADFGTQANLASLDGQNASSMFQLSTSIFSAAGGGTTLQKAFK